MRDILPNYTLDALDTLEKIISFLKRKNRELREENLSEEELSRLTRTINDLAAVQAAEALQPPHDPQISFLSQAACVLNELSKLNCDDYLLKSRLDIRNLTRKLLQNSEVAQNQRLERLNEEKIFDVINLIKGCSRLSYDKAELPWDKAVLAIWIDVNFGNISSKGALSLLHSFAKLGFDSEDQLFLRTLKKIAKKAKNRIRNFSVKDIVDLIHSLAKAKLFDELSEITSSAKEMMEGHYNSMEPETADALLRANLFSRCFRRQGFFNEEEGEIIEALKLQCPEKIVYSSQFQQEIERQLEAMGWDILKREYPLDWVRRVDIVCKKGNIILFVEVDGPSHDLLGEEVINSATKRRDKINEFLIESVANNSKEPGVRHLYLKVPSYVTDLQALITNLITSSQEETKTASSFEEVKQGAEITAVDSAISAIPTTEIESREEEKKSGKKSKKKKGGAVIEEKKPAAKGSKKKGEKEAKSGRQNNTYAVCDEADFEAVLKEYSSTSTPEHQPWPHQSWSPGERELETAINESNVKNVKNILAGGVVDVNAYASQAGSIFLNRVLTRLSANGSDPEDARAKRDLAIINALIAAGAVYTESTKIANVQNGRKLFKNALKGKFFNAASLIFSRYENFLLTPETVSEIVGQGPADLIMQIAGQVQNRNNLWETILINSNFEEIAERLIEATILPTDPLLQLKFLYLGVGMRNETIVSAFVTPDLAISFIPSFDKFSPLQRAVICGYGNIVDILIKEIRESDLTPAMLQSLLQLACIRGHEAFIVRFAQQKSNLTTEGILGWESAVLTPLHSAAECGHVGVIKILLNLAEQYGLENYIEIKSEEKGLTPLYSAASCGKEEAVRYLISRKADVNAKATGQYDVTVMHVAAQEGYINIISVLLENGAEIDALTSYQMTPLDTAVVNSRLEVYQFLIARGARHLDESFSLLDVAETGLSEARAAGDQEKIIRAENMYQIIEQAAKLEQEAESNPSGSAAQLSSQRLLDQATALTI